MRQIGGPYAHRLFLAFAFAVGVYHTFFVYSYLRPSWREWGDAVFPWGPLFFSEWGRHAGRIVLTLLFFSTLPGLGAAVLRLWPGRSKDFFIQSGMGLAVWSLSGFLLAALQLSSPAVLKGASILLGLAGLGSLAIEKVPVNLLVLRRVPMLWAAGAIAAFYLLTTLVPETFYDALVYHLAVPQAYLQAKGLVDLPDIVHSRMPGFIQTLNLWGLAWSDDRLCKLLNLGFGLLLAGALGTWTARRWSARAGAWAALLFLSSPLVGVNLWSCANDLLCGFFFFLAFALWVENAEQEKGMLTLSGFFFGAAIATKYTALFAAPFFLWEVAVRFRRTRSWVPGVFFILGILIPLLPWWIRTGVFTGNPFFPQAASLFGGDDPEGVRLLADWDAEARGSGGFFYRALSLARESLWGVEAGRFGFAGPALLMLFPLAAFHFRRPENRKLWLCLFFSYVFFAWTTGRLRYFLPQLPLLFALTGAALDDFFQKKSSGSWLKGFLGLMVFLNVAWMTLVFQRFNQGWDVVWGRVSPRAYLRQEHIGVYGHLSQGAFDFLKDQGAQGRVLVIGDARSFRSPLLARASGSFNIPTYARWIREDPSPAGFVSRLQSEGFTYLLFNGAEFQRVTPAAYKTDEFLKPLNAAFSSLAPPVYSDRWTLLFKVPPSP